MSELVAERTGMIPDRAVRIGAQSYLLRPPRTSDPRFRLATALLSIQVLGQVVFQFHLSIAQILVSIGTAALVEVLLTARFSRAIAWPASAMLSGNGVALILRVPGTEHGDWWSLRGWWVFAAISAMSVFSKYALRWRGEQWFNPSNLGLVVGAVILGPTWADLQPLWWGPWSVGLVAALIIIFTAAVVVTRRLGQVSTALSFLAALGAGLAILAASGHCIGTPWHVGPLCGWSFWWIVMTSPEVLIFAFFMITDPRTSPRGPLQRIAFGAIVGVGAVLLMAPQTTEWWTKLAILLALVLTCLFRPLLEYLISGASTPHSWRSAMGEHPRRWLVAVPVLVGLSATTIWLGEPARPGPMSPALGSRPVAIDRSTLPPVALDPSVERIAPPIDRATAETIVADLLDGLAIEQSALRSGDQDLASSAVVGGRLEAIEHAISHGVHDRSAEVTYEASESVVQAFGATPQAPREIQVKIIGSRSGGTSGPWDETYTMEKHGDHYLIAGPAKVS